MITRVITVTEISMFFGSIRKYFLDQKERKVQIALGFLVPCTVCEDDFMLRHDCPHCHGEKYVPKDKPKPRIRFHMM